MIRSTWVALCITVLVMSGKEPHYAEAHAGKCYCLLKLTVTLDLTLLLNVKIQFCAIYTVHICNIHFLNQFWSKESSLTYFYVKILVQLQQTKLQWSYL